MEAEAAPLLEALQLSRDDPPRIPPPAPCISFSGRVQDLDVHIVCNGGRGTSDQPAGWRRSGPCGLAQWFHASRHLVELV